MVLLDVMLPKLNGFEVCQAIREFSEMPIIMLTAKGDDMDKILGLEYGADDYITKPFNILEVKARIKAILRRNSKKSRQEPQQTKKVIEAGDLTLDSDSRRVFIASREINLTAKEFDLLELLVCNPGKVYSREELLRFVWGNRAAAGGDVRTVDVHVRRLREKIEPSPSDPKYVHTKWTGKRVDFLKYACAQLGLTGVEFAKERAEEAARKVWREQFDLASARAVAALPMLAEYCLPLVKVGGNFLAMKGASGEEELTAARGAIKKLGGEYRETRTLHLPGGDTRTLILCKKISQTPTAYPRNGGKIAKSPLK